MDSIEQDEEFNRFLNNWRKALYDGYEESGLIDAYKKCLEDSSIADCSTLPISIYDFKCDDFESSIVPYPPNGELQPERPFKNEHYYGEYCGKEFPTTKDLILYIEKHGYEGWINHMYQLTLYHDLLKTAQKNKTE